MGALARTVHGSSKPRRRDEQKTLARASERRLRGVLRSQAHVDWLTSQLRALKVDSENAYVVTIEREKDTRTLDQNRLYWRIVSELCEACGQDKEAMHAWLKAKFLGKRFVEVEGEVFEYPVDSRHLKVREFHKFVEDVANWAAETFGLVVLL